MTPSYFISITATRDDFEITLAIFNTAGVGQSIYGEHGNSTSKSLWIIPKGKKNEQEVFDKLQSVPAIKTVDVVSLSNPVELNQLVAVRSAFNNIGWDASKVTDDDLLYYLNDCLKLQFRYYVDVDQKKNNEGLVMIQLRPLEEHPAFTPDWLQGESNMLEELENLAKEFENKEFTINDFRTETVTFETTDDPDEEYEPPPPSGNDLKE